MVNGLFFTSNKTKHSESDGGGLILYVFVYIYTHLPHPYPTVPAAALPSPLTGTDLLRHLAEALGYRLPGGGKTRK